MPSELTVPLAQITNIHPHSNPEVTRLELATVLGWQIVIGKGSYTEGEVIVYIPPDSILPKELSDELGITKFLSNGRVRQVKLQNEPSFGVTVPLDIAERYGVDPSLPLGTNVATELGITKYEAPLRASSGDAEEDHPLFVKYTSIENIRNYPNVFEKGETVTLAEKIHGTNCRVGMIEGEFMAWSHALRRKEPELWDKNTYWYPLSLASVRHLLEDLSENGKQVILFGEVFGNVQKKYNYGVKNGIGFRAFDLLVDGKYLDHEEFVNKCELYGVPMVPLFNTMAYDYDNIVKSVEAISKTSQLSDEHPMEGVVIKPVKERYDHKVGRCVLKYVTDSFLFDKNKTDFTDR